MIQVAKNAGFCFGVDRAVSATYEQLKESEKKLFTLGEIIHNEQVIADLEKKGVSVIENLKDVNPVTDKVIIRAHGVSKQIYDELEARNIEYLDCTCPYVKKIHNIVHEKFLDGYHIVVIGKSQHPEVIGINGWCENTATILYDEEKCLQDLKKYDKMAIVAQTTIDKVKFYKIIKILKNYCNEIQIFDTICSATSKRQDEAEKIAKESDVMIVVGGKDSSNSKELYLKCKHLCPQTYLIQTADQLAGKERFSGKKIGITAGASTPAYIIKEVLNIMSEEKNISNGEENFADILEQYLNSSIHTGQVIKGTVDRVSATEVNVNIPGYKGVGVISLDNLTDDPQVKANDLLNVGDEIEAFVIKTNDVEGIVQLSKKRVDSMKNIEKIKEAFETQEILTGKVVEINKGGLSALVNHVKVFVPNSLATERYTEDISFLMGTEVSLKIIDFNEQRRRAVGSIKAVLMEKKKEQQEKFWADAEVGKAYSGVVKSLTNFGAFVDLGGVDGLIHITELSWGRIKHPSEIVNVGDIVDVYIKDLDTENKKISLGFKKAEDNPWLKVQNEMKVGDVINVKVVRLVPFGAFAEVIPFVDGLIHISQISDKRIAKPADVLTIGEQVDAKIIELDIEKQKISLSIRALIEEGKAAEAAVPSEEVAAEEVKSEETTVEPVAEETTDAE
ncbi:bifunctional 4-hydroxy-3-methylbut-2-enyl diphosphate reductase/30S ribosomal protein S1 [Acetivibrio sp. MSJd-27]|uniref:bifunctional 4-hydroxy-3-methylbut-2-enyl diphosphate reductase/30S ribosomal protein S1 n=1 Tax=Acetivibrio sp. MSJd-27 TaxID=2841523 RepID=UPI001C0F7998|nr:bifunctional 4-hydroxy-3-methylbut-2-enyl diphosphate reductase/30S ribosomal protein S1 [Acetivibrio sp. MSJd-27]MBU5449671.1 bifunctional 4-hydroxy-3-methylbut-2-enyl diphosphate reductase/30S ribosomal protein S1 [Acetivibrio sp. MSJd-27]